MPRPSNENDATKAPYWLRRLDEAGMPVSQGTFRNWCAASCERLPSPVIPYGAVIKLGSLYRFDPERMERWIAGVKPDVPQHP
jgi:hypothetical protein